jgi:hypothetical protein
MDNYALLSDREKAAVDWAVEENYKRELANQKGRPENIRAVKETYEVGIFQTYMRKRIAERPPEKIRKLVEQYNEHLERSFDIGSMPGRSLTD